MTILEYQLCAYNPNENSSINGEIPRWYQLQQLWELQRVLLYNTRLTVGEFTTEDSKGQKINVRQCSLKHLLECEAEHVAEIFKSSLTASYVRSFEGTLISIMPFPLQNLRAVGMLMVDFEPILTIHTVKKGPTWLYQVVR